MLTRSKKLPIINKTKNLIKLPAYKGKKLTLPSPRVCFSEHLMYAMKEQHINAHHCILITKPLRNTQKFIFIQKQKPRSKSTIPMTCIFGSVTFITHHSGETEVANRTGKDYYT